MFLLRTFMILLIGAGVFQIGRSQCTSGTVSSAPANAPYTTLLDPDSDGFITASGGAFTSGTNELAEFEALSNSTTGWIEIQDVSETNSDITPNCGNSDLITDDNGGAFAFYNIIDPTPANPSNGDEYIALRFRLAKSPNGNFGYNFLFDTDATYGAGVDINAICGNRGFEREIQFANAGGKKGVSAYDVDGGTTMNALSPACSQCVAIADIQEACAASSGGCATSDPQFITFALPLSHVGIPSDYLTSDLYISVASASSGNATSVLGGGNVTDFGAINGDDGGCTACTGLSGCDLFDCQTTCVYNAFSPSLPVELVYFAAKKKNDKVLLNWSTATEINNSHFEIEHSTDAQHFQKIGIIQGHGTTVEAKDYHYTDYNPATGLNYYRLKQMDRDGQFEHSDLQVVNYSNELNFQIFPNIANDFVQLSFEKNEKAGSIYIMNSMGKPVKEVTLSRDDRFITIDITNLPNGQYFVQTKSGSDIMTKRFIKIW